MGQLVETGARCCDCNGFVVEREGFGLVPRTKNDVGMNHLFPDILPVFCSTFSWLWSLGRGLFLSRLSGVV